MKWKSTIAIAGLVILAAVIGGFIGHLAIKPKEVAVASVNGENITKDQLYDEMLKSGGKDSLDTLISQKLVTLEAAKQNIVISDDDIQTELQKYYDNYGSQDAFNQALASNGYTLDQFKTEVVSELTIKQILEPTITITDDEMKSYFDDNKTQFAPEGQTADYETSKADVREAVLQSKIEAAYSPWIDTLYQQYSVKNYLYPDSDEGTGTDEGTSTDESANPQD
jgi:foldase protein PrsA